MTGIVGEEHAPSAATPPFVAQVKVRFGDTVRVDDYSPMVTPPKHRALFLSARSRAA